MQKTVLGTIQMILLTIHWLKIQYSKIILSNKFVLCLHLYSFKRIKDFDYYYVDVNTLSFVSTKSVYKLKYEKE